jgi:hypothetical protein
LPAIAVRDVLLILAPGGLEADMNKERRFEVRNRISSRMGSISVRTLRNDHMRMVRACEMREKGLLKAWES